MANETHKRKWTSSIESMAGRIPQSSLNTILFYTLVLGAVAATHAAPLPSPNVPPYQNKSFADENAKRSCAPISWTGIAVFYVANYVAHAATIHTIPGEATNSIMRSVLSALLFPTAGIARGLNAIFRCAIYKIMTESELQGAARAGALCMVIRSQHWVEKGDPCEGLVRMTAQKSNEAKEANPSDSLLASHMRIEDGPWMKEMPKWWPYFDTALDRPQPMRPDDGHQLWWHRQNLMSGGSSRKIHGTCILPWEYDLAFVPRNAKVVDIGRPQSPTSPKVDQAQSGPDEITFQVESSTTAAQRAATEQLADMTTGPATGGTGQSNQKQTQLSTSYGTAKALVALLQTVYAGTTLVRSSGQELDSFGYAAFGLTVSPYIIMSAINFLGNILTPNYPALYLVQSDVLLEALEREQTIINGQIGKLVPDTSNYELVVEAAKCQANAARRTATGSGSGEPGTEPLQSSVPYVEEVRLAHPPFERSDFAAISKILIQRETDNSHSSSDSSYLVKAFPTLGRFKFFQRGARRDVNIHWWSYPIFFALSLTVGCSSFLIIGLKSHFHKGQSTYAQRIWTMTWLGVGIAIGSFAAFYSAILEYRDRQLKGLSDMDKFTLMLLMVAIFAAPAVGGFVVVGQMLKSYGDCGAV